MMMTMMVCRCWRRTRTRGGSRPTWSPRARSRAARRTRRRWRPDTRAGGRSAGGGGEKPCSRQCEPRRSSLLRRGLSLALTCSRSDPRGLRKCERRALGV
ncbi:hypothetical protein VFPFJ_07014 [Purpureocillium lilacinum]|uniref:Uncharacterized protein n=1 Tax=Purpureocillium lilacinum TaxID=33203 RepID=A0A179GRB5_PURLI|nr:hypothetical protein VFPFJ_07014 [Purpureocillium lilacinum]OAQ80048.1 hypothetical protein VFPBJ_05633 [Purpureocillium lilacinum]OAQ88549.1 hypothetical protein VFPFJ_07014 [Purpureocillium lilacinum]